MLEVVGKEIKFEIDLAMIRPTRKLLNAAVSKAQEAYGKAILDDLAKAGPSNDSPPARLPIPVTSFLRFSFFCIFYSRQP